MDIAYVMHQSTYDYIKSQVENGQSSVVPFVISSSGFNGIRVHISDYVKPTIPESYELPKCPFVTYGPEDVSWLKTFIDIKYKPLEIGDIYIINNDEQYKLDSYNDILCRPKPTIFNPKMTMKRRYDNLRNWT